MQDTPLNRMKLVEAQNKKFIQRIYQLEQLLERFVATQTKQEDMMRKQVFRLNKENFHLVAKLKLMEHNNKNQQEVARVLVRLALELRSTPEQQPSVCLKKETKLNFNPIYD